MKKVSTFQKRLQELMDFNGVTAAKLSRDTNISKSLLSKYINGASEPKQENIEILKKYFNVDYFYLFGYESEKSTLEEINEMLNTLNDKELKKIYRLIKILFIEN